MSSTPHNHGSPTPTSTPPLAQPSSSSYLSYPVSHVVSSLYRRLTDSALPPNPRATPSTNNGLYTPPRRTASPFQPPPLTPLSLRGFDSRTSTPILSRTLAEEIRLLLPPRLQLVESWVLAYSLEQDGVSLGTLYHKCASPNLPLQSSFVLVVRDAAGGVRISLSSPALVIVIPRLTRFLRFSAPILHPPRTPLPPTTARANVFSGVPHFSQAHLYFLCRSHHPRPRPRMQISPEAPPSLAPLITPFNLNPRIG